MKGIHPVYQTLPISFDGSLVSDYTVENLPLKIAYHRLSMFKNLETPSHWNNDLEVFHIDKGELIVVINGEEVLLHSDDIIIVNSGCIHYLKSVNGEDCTFYFASLNELLFSNAPTVYERYICPLFHAFHPNYAMIAPSSSYHANIVKHFKTIEGLSLQMPTAYELLIIGELHLLIASLYAALKDTFFLSISVDSPEAATFRNMLKYIYENYSKKITVDNIAAYANVSRRTCYNMFYKYTGKSPLQFLTEYRLGVAKGLLDNTSLSLSEIATDTGFAHQSHFTNHFHKEYEITPLQYRKRVKK